MQAVTLQAYAKLNLYLYLTGKRADGYHTLESLVVFTELADTLTIREYETLRLGVDGEFSGEAGDVDTNLVMRAARALMSKAAVKKGALLQLTKSIPVGAGLGGGSADAAAALRGLNRFWNINLSQRDLRYIASSLGADVAMCLDSIPAIARGIGDDLFPVLPPPPTLTVLLVYPRLPLLTKDVYAASRLGDPSPEWKPISMHPRAFIESLKHTSNHLQRPAIRLAPAVAEVIIALETLKPAPDIIRMSGSGACCFGLYVDGEAAQQARMKLSHQHPDWWVNLTRIR